jgi:hypothetical protein
MGIFREFRGWGGVRTGQNMKYVLWYSVLLEDSIQTHEGGCMKKFWIALVFLLVLAGPAFGESHQKSLANIPPVSAEKQREELEKLRMRYRDSIRGAVSAEYGLGLTYEQNLKYEQALVVYKKLSEQHPANPVYKNDIVRVQEKIAAKKKQFEEEKKRLEEERLREEEKAQAEDS